MDGKKDPERTEYLKWSKSVTRFAKIFVVGICILTVPFVVGLKVLDMTSAVFWLSLIAFFIWSGCGFLILHKKVKEKEVLRASARNSVRPEITDPLFKEIIDEYEFNQLEGFTQNIFFHSWKLTCADDYNNVISLGFCKKQHEIMIDLSEEEISIIVDEETDTPTELVLNMKDFVSVEEVFNTITAVCQESVSKIDKL